MDISHHKLENPSWEPYNPITPLDDQVVNLHHHHHHQPPPFDHHHPPWPNTYYPLPNPTTTTDPSTQQNPLHPHPLIDHDQDDPDDEELGAMKEMMFKIAAMQPVDIDPATIRKPRRRNVRISDDPQSVAARHRRERISEKIRILQRLVPGGTKMDTASMLDEAIRYVKFLRRQIRILQGSHHPPPCLEAAPPGATAAAEYLFGGGSSDVGAGDEHPMF